MSATSWSALKLLRLRLINILDQRTGQEKRILKKTITQLEKLIRKGRGNE
jgi:hypothetical protein